MIRSFVLQKLTDRIVKILPKSPQNQFRSSYLQGSDLIVSALSSSPVADSVFRRFNLPNCRMCPLHIEETLEEAAETYGIDLEDWLMYLNFEIFIRQQEMLDIS